jgi:hypothetical protein
MTFKSPEVVVSDGDLSRQVFKFFLLDADLVLDIYYHQTRASKRHKWAIEKEWDRLDWRRKSRSNATGVEKPDVPESVIDQALDDIRNQITYVNKDK